MTYLPGMEDIGSEIMDQVIEAMEAYDYSKYTAADVKMHLHIRNVLRRISVRCYHRQPFRFGRDRTGSPDRDKKTFWKQCLYVHTDLYCKLL